MPATAVFVRSPAARLALRRALAGRVLWWWLGAVLLVVLAAPLPRWLCKLSAISALLVQLYFINGAAVPVYFGLELELEGWLPGEFIRFYGLTQWVGWLWPYAALLYLVVRLVGLARRAWASYNC